MPMEIIGTLDKYKLEWFLLTGAALFSGGSLYVDLQQTLEASNHMFMRSGAVVVLIAAFVEYRTSSHILKDIQRAAKLNKGKNLLIDSAFDEHSTLSNLAKIVTEVAPEPTKERKILSRCAHFLLLLGTVIWGYADFLA